MKLTPGKLLTVAIATALASHAMAQQTTHDPMSGPGSGDKIEAEMRIMDDNGDGKISAAEHAKGAQEMFKGMDGNQDSRVSAAEMDATQPPLKSHDASHQKGHQMSSAEKIKAVDSNGDGILTAQEHEMGSKKMFTKMDADKDGYLTTGEIKAGHQQLMMTKDE
jgi:Ca2+-binding EF-hand superfamily protein